MLIRQLHRTLRLDGETGNHLSPSELSFSDITGLLPNLQTLEIRWPSIHHKESGLLETTKPRPADSVPSLTRLSIRGGAGECVSESAMLLEHLDPPLLEDIKSDFFTSAGERLAADCGRWRDVVLGMQSTRLRWIKLRIIVFVEETFDFSPWVGLPGCS